MCFSAQSGDRGDRSTWALRKRAAGAGLQIALEPEGGFLIRELDRETIVGTNGSMVNGASVIRPSPGGFAGVRPPHTGRISGRTRVVDGSPPRGRTQASGWPGCIGPGARDARPRPWRVDARPAGQGRSPGPVATRLVAAPARGRAAGTSRRVPPGAGGSAPSPRPSPAGPGAATAPHSADTPTRRRRRPAAWVRPPPPAWPPSWCT